MFELKTFDQFNKCKYMNIHEILIKIGEFHVHSSDGSFGGLS